MTNATGYRESIPKEELKNYPSESYTGVIHVVRTESQATKVANYLLSLAGKDVLGFDTETRPSYVKGEIHKISLVQICTGKECFLFRTLAPGVWQQLKPVLEDEKLLKIGLSLKDDFHGMRKACDIKPQNFIELQSYVKKFGIKDCGLSRIYANIFQMRISKKERLTNWESAILTEEQKRYAALDAWATRRIYMELKRVEDESPEQFQPTDQYLKPKS